MPEIAATIANVLQDSTAKSVNERVISWAQRRIGLTTTEQEEL